ncbi:MAG: DEAD/DEAH box helicase family protein [Atopobiaceae bacterium]|nr:DEAD/DEAH box helicase family protein [Atopobiaceae bacterium]
MRIKLMDFQKSASERLLKNIAKMRREYEEDERLSATCLQAPTGSGKTVISADAIETLFFGNDELQIDGDEKACVLWISESPNLNAQTRNRFMSISDKLADTIFDNRHIETIGNDFCAGRELLDKHHVYFLSKDLLGKGKLLTKGSEANGGRTFWDVLNRTIQDRDRHLYLFIDEAHRGLGENKSSETGTPTIYANLIDGADGRMPMPIVIGISATPQRFEKAMMTRPNRDLIATVEIKPSDVQESGLLKDVIELRIPAEDDHVEHQYIDMACERFDLARQRWAAYCEKEDEDTVTPVLVMQVVDGISNEALKTLCDQVMHKLPDLNPQISFAHVFGSRSDIAPGGKYYIPYIEPENVADTTSVQVLFAKEAISNGWDCPRAEVIFSQRRRTNPTYITQLIGRMVRTPLARRIDSDESLNSVACYLSDFNPEAAQDVVDYLTGKKDDLGVPPVSEVLVDPVRVEPVIPRTREDYDREVAEYEKQIEEAKKQQEEKQETLFNDINNDSEFDEIDETPVIDMPAVNEKPQPSPSISKPQAKSFTPPINIPKPAPLTKRDNSFTADDMKQVHEAWDSLIVERVPFGEAKNSFIALLDTATLMMDTGWDSKAGEDVRKEFCKRLDAQMLIHSDEYKEARHKVEVAEMEIISIDKLHGNTITYAHDDPIADDFGIATAAKAADKVFGGKDLVKEYRKQSRLINKLKNREVDLRLAAVSNSPSLIREMQNWAKSKRDEYLETHRLDRDYVSEEYRQEYDRLQNESGLAIERSVQWPSGKMVSGSNDEQGKLARYPKHILQDEDGLFPAHLNNLENHVLSKEMTRSNAVAFYRNPEHARTPTAFSVIYTTSLGKRGACHPDFIFFMRDSDGKVRPAIVDGHGAHLDDAIAKLKGYVRYIQLYPEMFAQFISVSDLSNSTEYRAVDLKDLRVQDLIMNYSDDSAESLYTSELSLHYGDRGEIPELMKAFNVVQV